MKRIVFLLSAAALVTVGGILWARQARTGEAGRLTFKTALVQTGDVTQRVTTSGTLSALTTVAVGSQVSGNILKLHADYNDAVKAGQLIAEIEPSTYQAKLFQAEADLLSARATLELKQLNARRSSELLAQALVSPSDHDQAAAELHQQEAQTRKAEAAVQNARVDLERCQITSPIDGVVLSRAVDVGQTVQANFSAPTLFTLAQDLRRMQITANVSEADVGNVAAGQDVAFTVDAFPGRTFAGTVREVRNNSTTTSNVVTYPTIIVVANDELKLRPGMTANVTITTARRAGVLRLPNAALRFRPPAAAPVRVRVAAGERPPRPPGLADEGAIAAQPRTVYVLSGAGELVPTPVEVGLADTTHAEIVSGLTAGAIVVTGTSTGAAMAVGGNSATGTTNPFAPARPPAGGPPPR